MADKYSYASIQELARLPEEALRAACTEACRQVGGGRRNVANTMLTQAGKVSPPALMLLITRLSSLGPSACREESVRLHAYDCAANAGLYWSYSKVGPDPMANQRALLPKAAHVLEIPGPDGSPHRLVAIGPSGRPYRFTGTGFSEVERMFDSPEKIVKANTVGIRRGLKQVITNAQRQRSVVR